MNALLIVLAILAGLWIFGKLLSGYQDDKELSVNPNHPVRLSKKLYPIGSGTCPVRNGDRHIWDYGSYDEEMGPTDRYCKHCGKHEYRLITSGKWQSPAF